MRAHFGRDSGGPANQFLAHGPSSTAEELKEQLGVGKNNVSLVFDLLLSTEAPAKFSKQPIAMLEIKGRSPAGVGIIRRRPLYTQDFAAEPQVQSFRFELRDAELRAKERVEAGVFWLGPERLSFHELRIGAITFNRNFAK